MTAADPTGPAAAEAHHGLSGHEVVLLLETDPQRGLDDDEAARRLRRYGANVLPTAVRDSTLRRLLRQFHHPLIYILIAAGVVTAVFGEYIDSAVILAVVLINAAIGFIQESKAEAALESLRAMARTESRVIRAGRGHTVPAAELVPGDLVLLEAGDRVPVDVRLIRVNQLRVDESALTGESLPTSKDEVALPETTPVADRRNMAYSGTLVTAGSGASVAVSTGAQTELGEIHRLVGAAETLATPLTGKLNRFSRVLTVVILALALLTFGVGLLRGQGAADTFTAAIALAVGAIPEGLPAAVTITLAIGVTRMARRRAVIRRLPAVETLGSTTVICSDKTGTLTENQMTVRAVWTPSAEFTVTGSGYSPEGELRAADGTAIRLTVDQAGHPEHEPVDESLRWCLLVGAGCNDARLSRDGDRWELIGDPTEGAMLTLAAKAGLDPASVSATHARVATIPFSSERQYMATLHDDRVGGGQVVLAKGAVERILALCVDQLDADGGRQPVDADAVHQAVARLADRGLRVLATASGPAPGPDQFTEENLPGTLTLTGLQAMLDPPRRAAAAAVRACHSAGISVKMITGDHAATATAIAATVNLLGDERDGQVRTGAELAEMPEPEFGAAVDRARVFARVSPEQKLRLVETLQQRGQVVAVTGDGVNDAPALRQANIGVAMSSGTEVAKEAADMVLTDDDFATIEAAVEEGRGVFDNLTKFIVWTLPTNLGEGLVVLVAIMLGATLPILPTQILWINMTTAVALGLMLAFEPKEPGIMRRAPRDPARPLLTAPLVVRILLVSALLVGGTWWLFEWEQARGASVAEARTAALNLFVVVEAFYLFTCRSLTRSVWRVGLFTNRWILAGLAVQTLGQLAITYLPPMNTAFSTAPISADVWLRIFALAGAATAVVAVDKRLRRQQF